MHKSNCNRVIALAGMLLVGWCIAGANAADLKVTVINIEGDEQPESLKEITDSGFKFENGGVSAREIAELRFNAGAGDASASKATVHLRNGDRICAVITAGDDTKLSFKNTALGDVAIDNKYLDGIVFKQKDNPPAETIDAFFRQALTEDALLLPKGDIAKGAIEKIGDKDLSFNVEKQSKQFAFEQVLGVRLAPLEEYKAPSDFRAAILLTDGSRLTGKLKALKDNAVEFEGLDGKTWSVKAAEIKSFVFKGGNLLYLSELAPNSVEEKPYAGGVPVIFHWRRDQSAAGRPLSIAGKSFDKGIGVHSYSRLTYELGGQYAKFLTLVGLDASAPQSAACAWKVSVDGKEAASGIAKPNEPPKPLKLELNGAKELELLCDYGPDDDDSGDHLDWANARMIRK
jgi:hypothetical protein